MAVAIAGQGVVAFFLRAVDRPLQRAQHGKMHGVLLGPAHGGGQQLLQLEAALQAVGLVAQLGHELGAAIWIFCGLGDWWMRRRKCSPRSRSVSATASLAASMNSSMIWWLSVFSTTWAPVTRPVLVEFHFDLGHVQFERPVGQPPLAERHGQRVHPAQQVADLAAQLAAARPRGLRGTHRLARRSAACCCGWPPSAARSKPAGRRR